MRAAPRILWVLPLLLLGAAGCRWLAGYPAAAVDGAIIDGPQRDSGSLDGTRPSEGLLSDQRGDAGDGPWFDGAPGDRGVVDFGQPADGGLPAALPCYGGWCWIGTPTNDLNAVWARDANDFVAVGEAGTVLRYESGTWSTDRVGGDVDYSDVWGDAQGNAWIVGRPSLVLHRAQGAKAWTNETLPVIAGDAVNAVWGDGVGVVWAVGASQVLQRGAGGSWAIHTAGLGPSLVDITGTASLVLTIDANGAVWQSSAGAFIKGTGLPTNDLRGGVVVGGTIYAAAGSNGTVISPGVSLMGPQNGEVWTAVHGTSVTNIWAVSSDGSVRRVTSPTNWTPYPALDAHPLRGVWALGAQDAVVCGDAGYVAYRSASKLYTWINATTQQYVDVHVLASGEALLLTASNLIRRVDSAGVLGSATSGPPDAPATALWGYSTAMWAANSKGIYLKAATGTWVLEHGGSVDALWGDSPGNLWATAGSKIYRRVINGSYVDTGAPSISGTYSAIGGLGSVVVAGASSGQAALWQGSKWTGFTQQATNGAEITAVAVVDATTFYAVLEKAGVTTLWRWQGASAVTGSWMPQSLPQPVDVWSSGSTVLAATRSGAVYRLTNGSWTPEPLLTRNRLRAIHGSVGATGRVFAVGASSTVLRN